MHQFSTFWILSIEIDLCAHKSKMICYKVNYLWKQALISFENVSGNVKLKGTTSFDAKMWKNLKFFLNDFEYEFKLLRNLTHVMYIWHCWYLLHCSNRCDKLSIVLGHVEKTKTMNLNSSNFGCEIVETPVKQKILLFSHLIIAFLFMECLQGFLSLLSSCSGH